MPYPYSYVPYTITSGMVSSPVFSYGSLLLFSNGSIPHSSQLEVYLNGELQTLTTDYTVDAGTEEITMIATLEVDDYLQIKRSTELDERLVDYVGNNFLNESTADKDSNQLFYLIQELYDRTADSITKAADGACWDGQGLEACNFAQATANDSLVTLGQVFDVVGGAQTAELDNCLEWTFTGDGSETDFTLTGLVGNTTACNLFIEVAGVTQVPTTAYTVDDTVTPNEINFVTAPANGAPIHVRLFQGTVQAVLGDGAINGDSIISGTIPPTALDVGTVTSPGGEVRVMKFNDAGEYVSTTELAASDIYQLTGFIHTQRLDQLTDPSGNINMNSNQIVGMAAGTGPNHAVSKSQMEAAIAAAVPSSSGNARADSRSFSLGTSFTSQTATFGWQPDGFLVMFSSNGRITSTSLGGVLESGGQVEVNGPTNRMSITATSTGYTIAMVAGTMPAGSTINIIAIKEG